LLGLRLILLLQIEQMLYRFLDCQTISVDAVMLDESEVGVPLYDTILFEIYVSGIYHHCWKTKSFTTV
jgi:hypothetical protein